jgi:hypothetical protein
MKTVKPVGENGGVPVRVKDEEASIRVKSGKWVLCDKTEWKKEVRDRAEREAEAKAKQKELEAKQARKKEVEKKIVGKK